MIEQEKRRRAKANFDTMLIWSKVFWRLNNWSAVLFCRTPSCGRVRCLKGRGKEGVL